MPDTLETLGITADKIRQYDQRIPRYTSYPTAPFWREEFDAAHWREHLDATSGASRDLSLYVHIPFCAKHCLFCACNVIITTKEGISDEYVAMLEQDIALARARHHGTARVVQLHFGGGTPNYLTNEQMGRVMAALRGAFDFSPEAEISIEVDPRRASPDGIAALGREHGFRRISFGVQDFHEETQHAIGREQTREITFANAGAARAAGFESVNIDLIYGLPRQTAESWNETLDAVVELRPDRIALYNFAYLPGRLAHQRKLENEELPPPALKLEMFIAAHNRLTTEGWEFIGMDHYARREDSLAQAQREGSLRRNFMGYTTLRGTDMLAFGVSAISDFQGAFTQNVKKLSQYGRMLDAGELPVERGLRLSGDDLLRRFVIEELMCNGVLRRESPDFALPMAPWELATSERAALGPLEEDGLLEWHDDRLVVTQKGRIFLRNIAVVFDAYVQRAKDKPLFSRAV